MSLACRQYQPCSFTRLYRLELLVRTLVLISVHAGLKGAFRASLVYAEIVPSPIFSQFDIQAESLTDIT